MNDTMVIVQARAGSSRLPGKAFMRIANADIGSVTQLCVSRAMRSGLPVTVAVPHDDVAAFQKDLTMVIGIWSTTPYAVQAWTCGGDAQDVLQRFAEVDLRGARYVCRITGDCPLIDPCTIKAAVGIAEAGHLPYLDWGNCPDGNDVEVIRVDALWDAHINAESDSDREHVTPWIRRKYPTTLRPKECPGIKYSVDTQEDLDRVRRIVKALGANCTRDQIIAYLRENP